MIKTKDAGNPIGWNYPSWICSACGDRYCNGWPPGHVGTFHENTCDVCQRVTAVTEPRDFRGMKVQWRYLVSRDMKDGIFPPPFPAPSEPEVDPATLPLPAIPAGEIPNPDAEFDEIVERVARGFHGITRASMQSVPHPMAVMIGAIGAVAAIMAEIGQTRMEFDCVVGHIAVNLTPIVAPETPEEPK